MHIYFWGFSLNLSFFQISDILALIVILIVTSFKLIPESKVKNPWIRRLIIAGAAIVFLIAQHFLLQNVSPLSNHLPQEVNIRWYGVLIMLGALGAAFMAVWGAKRKGLNPNAVWDMLPWLLIAGIIGARLWHVFTPSRVDVLYNNITTMNYLQHPLQILEIWKGGLGIPGAVIGGGLALWIYGRIKKQSFAEWVDIIAPGLALAQAVGRWGNYFNQELYGLEAKPPLGIPIRDLTTNQVIGTFLPLFWYEAAWNLLNMGLLLWLGYKYAKKLIKGDIFLIYIMFYAFGRFWLEFLRLDQSMVGNVDINQLVMAILFVGALTWFLLRHFLPKKKQEVAVEELTVDAKIAGEKEEPEKLSATKAIKTSAVKNPKKKTVKATKTESEK
jgi:phosphatidylglycerol:prolipoprotein diacylglycerol transferase